MPTNVDDYDVCSIDQLERELGTAFTSWWLDPHHQQATELPGQGPTKLEEMQLRNWLREPFELNPKVAPYGTLLIERLDQLQESASPHQEDEASQDEIEEPVMSPGVIARRGTFMAQKPLLPVSLKSSFTKTPNLRVRAPTIDLSPDVSPMIQRRAARLSRMDTFVADDKSDLKLLGSRQNRSNLDMSISEEGDEDMPPRTPNKKPIQSDLPHFSRTIKTKARTPQLVVPIAPTDTSLSRSYEGGLGTGFGSSESVHEQARLEEMSLRASVEELYSKKRNKNLASTSSNPDMRATFNVSSSLEFSTGDSRPKPLLRSSYDILNTNTQQHLARPVLNESYTLPDGKAKHKPVNRSYDLLDPRILAKRQEEELRDSLRSYMSGATGSAGPLSSNNSSNPDLLQTYNLGDEGAVGRNSTEDMAKQQELALKASASSFYKRRSGASYDRSQSRQEQLPNVMSSNQTFNLSLSGSHDFSQLDDVQSLAQQQKGILESSRELYNKNSSRESLASTGQRVTAPLTPGLGQGPSAGLATTGVASVSGVCLRKSYDRMPKVEEAVQERKRPNLISGMPPVARMTMSSNTNSRLPMPTPKQSQLPRPSRTRQGLGTPNFLRPSAPAKKQ